MTTSDEFLRFSGIQPTMAHIVDPSMSELKLTLDYPTIHRLIVGNQELAEIFLDAIEGHRQEEFPPLSMEKVAPIIASANNPGGFAVFYITEYLRGANWLLDYMQSDAFMTAFRDIITSDYNFSASEFKQLLDDLYGLGQRFSDDDALELLMYIVQTRLEDDKRDPDVDVVIQTIFDHHSPIDFSSIVVDQWNRPYVKELLELYNEHREAQP